MTDHENLELIINKLREASLEFRQLGVDIKAAFSAASITCNLAQVEDLLVQRANLLISLQEGLLTPLTETDLEVQERVLPMLALLAAGAQQALESEQRRSDLLSLALLVLPWGSKKEDPNELDLLANYVESRMSG